MAEVLPWLNLLMIPTLGYVLAIARYMVAIDNRITRLEALREADDHMAQRRRVTAST